MEVIIKQSYILTRLMKIFGYYSPVTIIIAITLITWTILYNKKRSRLVRLINKIPGPPSLPLLGNTVEINVDHDGKQLIILQNSLFQFYRCLSTTVLLFFFLFSKLLNL